MNKNNLLIVILILVLGIAATYWMKTTTPAQVSPENNWNDWDNQQKPENNWNDWKQPGPQNPQAPQMPPAPQQPNVQPPAPSRANSFQDALNLSKVHKKPVLLFFTASWCGYCQQMKNQTMPNASVQEAMKKFIYCEIDVDRDRATARKFGVGPIPTYKIIDESQKTLAEGSGFKSPTQFVTWMSQTNQLFKNW